MDDLTDDERALLNFAISASAPWTLPQALVAVPGFRRARAAARGLAAKGYLAARYGPQNKRAVSWRIPADHAPFPGDDAYLAWRTPPAPSATAPERGPLWRLWCWLTGRGDA